MMQPVSPPLITPSRPSVLAVYAGIQQQLLATLERLREPLPSFGVGKRDVFNHNGMPRITWQPKGGEVDRTESGYFDNPRALWSRNFLTIANLWAPGIDAANDLANHLVAAIDAVVHGAYRIVREKWDVTGDRDSGNAVALHFVVEAPLIDDVSSTVKFIRILAQGEFTREAVI